MCHYVMKVICAHLSSAYFIFFQGHAELLLMAELVTILGLRTRNLETMGITEVCKNS